MIATAPKPNYSQADIKLGQQFLRSLRSLLVAQHPGLQRLVKVQAIANGDVQGQFQAKEGLFNFSVEEDGVRYQLASRADAVARELALTGCPLPLGDDSYSGGFLDVFRGDKGKGIPCGRSYIEASDQCRIKINTPAAQRQIRDVRKVAKILGGKQADGILTALIGAGAIAAFSFAAGSAIGGYMGAASARATARPVPQPDPVYRERVSREPIPDPWDDVPTPEPKKGRVKKTEKLRVVSPERSPEQIVQVAPDDIRLAPKLFQYKLPNEISSKAAKDLREQGTTGALSDVDTWNPAVAGVLKVWRVPKDFKQGGQEFKEGEILLVHGHHRLALAKRAGAIASENPTQPPTAGKVDKVNVQFIDAADWKEARTRGALENVAAGAGTARDAANIFRELKINDLEPLKQSGFSMRNAIAEQGLGLAGLNDRLWKKASDPNYADMSLRKLSYIGQIKNSDLQDEVEKQVLGTRAPSDDFVRSLSQSVQHQLATGQIQTRSGGEDGQNVLFDMTQTVANLADRAEIDAFVERSIIRESSFWKKAANPRRMRSLLQQAQAGDVDVQRAEKVSEQAGVARYLYQRGKYLTSDPNYQKVNDLLIQAGHQLREMKDRKAPKQEIDALKNSTFRDIRELLAGEMG